MKKFIIVVFCLIMILSVIISKPLDASASTITDEEDERYTNEVAQVTKKYMSINDGIVKYDILRMEKALKGNPYGKDAVATAKDYNNKQFNNESINYDKSSNSFTAATTSNPHCGVFGKKDNVKYWNSLNSCLEKKIKNIFTLPHISSTAIATIIDHVLDGEFKKATGKLSKYGGKLASKGNVIVTLLTMEYTCIDSAQKKYPPGGCI